MSFDPIKTMPKETNLMILSYLNKSDLAKSSQSSKGWNLAANDSKLWKKIAEKIFTSENLKIPCTKDFLIKFTYQNLKSNNEIVQRIQDFIRKIQVGQKAKFTCFLGRGQNYQAISIEILPKQVVLDDRGYHLNGGPQSWMNNSEFDLEEDCFSLNKLADGELSTSIHADDVIPKTEVPFGYSIGCHPPNDTEINFYSESYKAYLRLPSFLNESSLQKRIFLFTKAQIIRLETDHRKSLYDKAITLVKFTGKFLANVVSRRS